MHPETLQLPRCTRCQSSAPLLSIAKLPWAALDVTDPSEIRLGSAVSIDHDTTTLRFATFVSLTGEIYRRTVIAMSSAARGRPTDRERPIGAPGLQKEGRP